MPSRREGSRTSSQVHSSEKRGSASPIRKRKSGAIKTTLPSGKGRTATKKFYYERSYDGLVEGKIERGGSSPYYKKTVSFMAKNLD